MSEKCSHHKDKRKRFIRRLCAAILIVLFIILLTILIVWAVLQPKKPSFTLLDATVFNLTVPAPNILTTNMQVTIRSRNPNDNIGIRYDKFDVYATYRSQQITYFTGIPPAYLGHKDSIYWSPFLYGSNVPIAPFNGLAIAQDQANGSLELKIRMDGRVKWKVGTINTGYYHIHVTCEATIPFGNRNTGIVVGSGIKYQLYESCSVNV